MNEPTRAASLASRDEVLGTLDFFRAGEELGAESIGAWLEVCSTDCVRGALRTIREREAMHARLLEARLRSLGATPAAEIPAAERKRFLDNYAADNRSDVQKLLDFTSQFPDPEALLRPLHDLADRLDHDPETQWLLRSILQDEKSTLDLVHQACRLLNG